MHHADPQPDASTGLRDHPVETALHVLALLALYATLGLPLWIEGVRAVIYNAMSLFQHANVKFPRQIEWLACIFVTPDQHRVHHLADRLWHDHNYGFVFSFWDHLFGTWLSPEAAPIDGESSGLSGYQEPRWQTVAGMLVAPWRTQAGDRA